MPTATVEVTRDCAYLVVVFRPLRGQPEFLPPGLYAFAPEDCTRLPQAVALRLAKDGRGGVDPMPLLAATDYLQDQGWEVRAVGWLVRVLAAGV